MGELAIPAESGNRVTKPTGSGGGIAKPGGSHSADDCRWDNPVTFLDDLGLGLPFTSRQEIASMFAVSGLVRRRGEKFFRRRSGWRAARGGVVVVASEQQLRRRSDGRFEPEGEWSPFGECLFEAAEEPKLKRGVVPQDANLNDPYAPLDDEGSFGKFQKSLSDIAFLPEVVRRGIAGYANPPHIFEAQALGYQPHSGSDYHTVAALKLNDAQAVVVSGHHEYQSPTWDVTQIVYRFDAGGAAIGDRDVPRLR